MWNYLIKFYLFISRKVQSIYHFFLRIFGPIYLVYYLDDSIIKNITLHYYIGHGLDQYSNGKYFCKVLTTSGTDHIWHEGEVHEIPMIVSTCDNSPEITNIYRKNIILYNHDKPVEIDLNLLDKYYCRNHTDQFVSPQVSANFKLIITCLGFECTHVHFIEFRPFRKKILPVDEVEIHDIYEIKEE